MVITRDPESQTAFYVLPLLLLEQHKVQVPFSYRQWCAASNGTAYEEAQKLLASWKAENRSERLCVKEVLELLRGQPGIQSSHQLKMQTTNCLLANREWQQTLKGKDLKINDEDLATIAKCQSWYAEAAA